MKIEKKWDILLSALLVIKSKEMARSKQNFIYYHFYDI